MINKNKLNGCDQRVIKLAEYLDGYFKTKYNTEIIITSGLRKGSGKSWHDAVRGAKAVDFVPKDMNIFKVVTELYYMCAGQESVFKGITEFEICRGKGMQHAHCAYGEEGYLETFTGVYR